MNTSLQVPTNAEADELHSESSKQATAEWPPMSAPRREHTVLVVDDARENRELMRTIFLNAGYNVLTASDGTEGFDVARRERPDLVISDVSMPGINGVTFCRLIRADSELGTTPLLLVSALHKDTATLVEGFQAGADDYLESPYDPLRLVAKAARLIEIRNVNDELEERVNQRTKQLQSANEELEREIAARRMTEQALSESDNRFKAFMDSIPAVAFVKDENGRYVYANRLFQRLRMENWRGRTDFEMWPEKIARQLSENDRSVLETGQTIELEETVPSPKGSPLEWWTYKFPLTDSTGARFIAGVAVDITARKGAEDVLLASQARLAGILDIAEDGIISIDQNHRITLFNQGAERIFGYTPSEVLGQKLDLLLPMRFLGAHSQHVENFSRSSQTAGTMGERLEVFGCRKDGTEFPAEVSISKLVLGNEVFFTSIVRDVTERRRLEEELRQSQKMECVGRLAGGVAHDFNNLLTVINGYSELLLKDFNEDDAQAEKLREIRKASKRAGSLTYQLLAFSRKQVLQPKVLDINAIVIEVGKMLRRLIGEDIEFVMVLHPGIGRVKADPGQISQIIINLAVNARDAMPRGGKFSIETANVHLDQEYVRHHFGAKPGPYVMLALVDTGTGMDADTQQRIFEPFFTTKELGSGTGLGLATVYGIVKQSGGYITVESESGLGSTFKIYLPLADGTDEAESAWAETPNGAMPGGTEKILLVEDELAVRTLTRQIFEMCGYEVLEARDGAEAVSISDGLNSVIDLLVTDVVMPEISGRELAEQLSWSRPEMRVLYMSGYTDDAIVRHGMGDGTAHFIQKPFTPEALAHKVREVLDTSEKS